MELKHLKPEMIRYEIKNNNEPTAYRHQYIIIIGTYMYIYVYVV